MGGLHNSINVNCYTLHNIINVANCYSGLHNSINVVGYITV